MKHRSRIEVIGLILGVANGGDVTKSRIMKRALLSYNQMQEHLMFLTEKDLLRYDEETHTFKTTEKGLRFLQIYGRIEGMMNSRQSTSQQEQHQQAWI